MAESYALGVLIVLIYDAEYLSFMRHTFPKQQLRDDFFISLKVLKVPKPFFSAYRCPQVASVWLALFRGKVYISKSKEKTPQFTTNLLCRLQTQGCINQNWYNTQSLTRS